MVEAQGSEAFLVVQAYGVIDFGLHPWSLRNLARSFPFRSYADDVLVVDGDVVRPDRRGYDPVEIP